MGMFAKLGAALASGCRAAKAAMMNQSVDAARLDDSWGPMPWPLDARQEVDDFDRRTIWQRARMLEKNCPPIRKAVRNMVHFTGSLSPLPATTDEEWNEAALRCFLARTKNKNLFDASARVNYKQAMAFIERCAIIDGDCAIIPTYAPDGGASFAFYRAPSVTDIETDALNRPLRCRIADAAGRETTLPGSQVWLYSHNVDPTASRGESELIAAIRHGRDIQQIVGYNKAAVKLAASMGLIMTKPLDDKHPGVASNVGSMAKKNLIATDNGPKTLMGTGLQITALPEGRDLKPIADTRPSQQVMQFCEFLVCCIAWAAGLDPEALFYSNKMGSAAVRFSLEKVTKWQEERLADLEPVCNSIWRHVISCEIACGRLRPCADPNWRNVRWVPSRDMTIDTSRVSTAQINLSREGMADADDFALRTTGSTVKQLARRKAANIAYMKRLCREYGLTMQELMAGMVGSVPSAPDAEPQTNLPDDDPETTE